MYKNVTVLKNLQSHCSFTHSSLITEFSDLRHTPQPQVGKAAVADVTLHTGAQRTSSECRRSHRTAHMGIGC